MQIDLEQAAEIDTYQLATHLVTPRPIAWVATASDEGVTNLAPFSYFGLVADDPILLVLSVGRRTLPGGIVTHKDTARNLLANGEAVIHIVEEAFFVPMVESAANCKPDESEILMLGLETMPSIKIRPPRLKGVSLCLECRVEQHQEIGNDDNDLFLLRAVYAHIADAAMTNGLPNAQRLRVIGKLGATEYAVTSELKSRNRPK